MSRQELEEIYVALEAPLYNFALRWTWNRALAQDMIQEAFLRVWQRKETLDKRTLKALLYKIVQNLAIDERRKSQFLKAIPIANWFVSKSKFECELEFAEREQWSEVKKVLEQLPDDLRKTFLLCQFSDLTQQEIGGVLGIPPGTVASRRNRAMLFIKEKLKFGEDEIHEQ